MMTTTTTKTTMSMMNSTTTWMMCCLISRTKMMKMIGKRKAAESVHLMKMNHQLLMTSFPFVLVIVLKMEPLRKMRSKKMFRTYSPFPKTARCRTLTLRLARR